MLRDRNSSQSEANLVASSFNYPRPALVQPVLFVPVVLYSSHDPTIATFLKTSAGIAITASASSPAMTPPLILAVQNLCDFVAYWDGKLYRAVKALLCVRPRWSLSKSKRSPWLAHKSFHRSNQTLCVKTWYVEMRKFVFFRHSVKIAQASVVVLTFERLIFCLNVTALFLKAAAFQACTPVVSSDLYQSEYDAVVHKRSCFVSFLYSLADHTEDLENIFASWVYRCWTRCTVLQRWIRYLFKEFGLQTGSTDNMNDDSTATTK